MRTEERRHVRAIVRRVHPDLFAAHPHERAINSESLKALNAYCDDVASGRRPVASRLDFFVREADGVLGCVEAPLPAHGSLGPLFLAFGLITEEELRRGAGAAELEGDTNFVEWLSETVAEAARTADQHEALKRAIRELRVSVEARFGLASVQVGGDFAVSVAEQQRQMDALKTLDAGLSSAALVSPAAFEGLSIRLYHPESCPFDTFAYVDDDGAYASGLMQSYVADDGCLHVVADRGSIRDALARLDLPRARLLTRLSLFWVRRVRDLSPSLRLLLGVDNLWCDTRTEQSAQKFVLWAGHVLEHRAAFEGALEGRRFAFSVLVHTDVTSAMVDFLNASSVLQVRADCPPMRLLEFLCSEAGTAVDRAAEQVADKRAAEEELLARVRDALGAKHVIRVCSSYDQDKVIDAAQRLLDNAVFIRSCIDLSGASIAIDDCYELWESGFISIPYNFQVDELQNQLQKKLLGSSPSPGEARSRASAAPAASNAVTYSSAAAKGTGSGGFGGSNGYSNGALGSEQSNDAVPSQDLHVNGSGSSSASHDGFDMYSSYDDAASASVADGSPETADGRHVKGGLSGNSHAGWDSTPREHGGSATSVKPGSWRDGIELEPAAAGSYLGYKQRSSARTSTHAAAVSAARTGIPGRAALVRRRGVDQQVAICQPGGFVRLRIARSSGRLRVPPCAAPLRPASGFRVML